MKVERFDGSKERRLLAHFIYSDELLAETARILETRPSLLRSAVENTFLEWCVKYYQTHGTAPKEDIIWILSDFESSPIADELGALVNGLPKLGNPVPFTMLLGEIGDYLDKIALEKLGKQLLSRVSQDDVAGCLQVLGKFQRVSLGVSTGINPFTDENALIETFSDDSSKSLLTFNDWGDDARVFFGDTFSRSSFVVFNAPEKGCKSATLLEFAIQALKEGKNVAYFEAGDMSRPQVFRRLYQRVAHHPRRAGIIQVPKDGDDTFWVDKIGDDGPTIHNELIDVPYESDLTLEIAKEGLERWKEAYGSMKERFRFADHPQDLTVPGIIAHLDEWEHIDGFKPDFVIVDYADILQPVTKNEFRHQVNDTFARLRGLSLDRKCCLITATQAKGGAYNADTQDRVLISEDKRKAAHPTAMIGLASVQEEREQQVYHMNFILRRDDVCRESQKLYFAQCLPLSNPMVKCYYPENHSKETHGQYKAEQEQARAISRSQERRAIGADSDKVCDPVFDFSQRPVEKPAKQWDVGSRERGTATREQPSRSSPTGPYIFPEYLSGGDF